MATESAQRSGATFTPGWTFGDKIRKARTIAGLDQREFAAQLDLTASTVAAYETGRSTPRFRDVGPLAKRIQILTGVDYTWFLDFEPAVLGQPHPGSGTHLTGVGTNIHRRVVGRTGLEPVTDGLWVAPVTPIRKRVA